ncbi:3-oxoadipate enol-lactonase [Herbaspirillum sp. RV1423]|uniref:3-oxoadipate enol-lactonase n=1 Tax=Herbaspirillum sp. RV1423 TaxID=1443993 RepID=UPI0004B3A4E6|nr:3-oxoadipate enol-lactonase [Herbaspirillum sp. RV1423]
MPIAHLKDVDLHYQLDGDASLPVLVLSNSLGTSLAMWEPQISLLSKYFRVLRYDTRGHGRSQVTPAPYSIPQLAGDVIGLLDQLGIAQAHFCGLSMGGSTVMWLAVHHPERVKRLVLCNTGALIGTAEAWTSRIATVQRDGVASIADAVVSRWLTPEFAQANPAKVKLLATMLKTTPDEGYAGACAAVRDINLREQIGGIKAPTLVVAGTGDIPTPPSDARFILSQIKDAQYVELGAAHISNQERPEEFTSALIKFLNS